MVYTFSVVDVSEYIASGIIESVVIGVASDQENRELGCMSSIYPEIKEEWTRVETVYERMTMEAAVAPAAEIKTQLMERIRLEKQLPTEKQTGEAKIVTMSSSQSNASSNPGAFKWLAAASVVLAIGLGALWLNTSNEASALSKELASTKTELNKDKDVLTAMTVEQERIQSIQAVLMGESTTNINLMGTAMEPSAKIQLKWNSADKKAVMVAEAIAPPPTNMQYQLWAIADGKPVSLGVFNYDEVERMTEPFEVNAEKITAFAITLEKMGGSPTPTMDKMVVLGAV